MREYKEKPQRSMVSFICFVFYHFGFVASIVEFLVQPDSTTTTTFGKWALPTDNRGKILAVFLICFFGILLYWGYTNKGGKDEKLKEIGGEEEKKEGKRRLTPEENKIVGSYKIKVEDTAYNLVFVENGIVEVYIDGKKGKDEKWKVVGGEVYMEWNVFRVESNGDLIWIAAITDGKRADFTKEGQWTYNKIK